MVWCSTAGIYALLERKLHDRQGDYMNKGNNAYQRLYPSHTRWYYRSFIAFLPTGHLVILMFFLLSITMPHIGWLASCAASLFYDDIGPSQGNRTFTSCCQGDSDSLEYVWINKHFTVIFHNHLTQIGHLISTSKQHEQAMLLKHLEGVLGLKAYI